MLSWLTAPTLRLPTAAALHSSSCVQPEESALDQAKFSQLEALLNRSQMYTQFLTEQVNAGPPLLLLPLNKCTHSC